MATIRSNLNSIPNTNGVTALKERFTTCFLKHWHCPTVTQQPAKYPQQQKSRPEQQNQKSQNRFYNFQHNNHIKEYSVFVQRKSEHLLKTIKKIFFPKRQRQNWSSSRASGEHESLKIVAKLLSSTLVAAAHHSTTTSTVTPNSSTTTTTTSVITKMTIIESRFMQVRDEYPDIDAEIRSILVSRAQSGATIFDIKDDYRKLTGGLFPVRENITEFLLSIPSVSAVCSEIGTLIFNIMPTDKTRHLYDMVVRQKPATTGHNSAYGNASKRKRFSPYQNTWRSVQNNNNNFRQNHQQQHLQQGVGNPIERSNNGINDCNRYYKDQSTDLRNAIMEENSQKQDHGIQTCKHLSNISSSEQSSSRCEFEGFAENNCFYQDNCNYLFNRLCSQAQQHQPPVTAIINHNNDNNFDLNNNNARNMNENFDLCQQNFPYNSNMPRSSFSPIRTSRYNDSGHNSEGEYEAHFLDFALLGDDFFLFLARMEMNCKFKKNEKVLQSGLCISGQTIRAATKIVRQMENNSKSIIVNIGSVDIMQGRSLVQIEHDFRELTDTMHRKGMKIYLTTVGPLANYGHDKMMKDKLERFNAYIKNLGQFLTVIDIWSCLVNERKQTLFDCFQYAPRGVTGTPEPYVFWNKIGRQRVLKMIETSIEY